MAFWKDLVKKFRGEESPASEYGNQPETVTAPAAPPAAPAAKPPVPPIVDPAAVYRKIRIQALSTPPESETKGDEPPFYGAVVDIASEQGCTTMVCRYPQEVDLYTKRGDIMMGVQKNAPSVQEAAALFWKVAAHFAANMTMMKDEDYQLPRPNRHRVFLLAREGICRVEIDPSAPYESGSMEQTLLYAYYHLFRCIAKRRGTGADVPEEETAPREESPREGSSREKEEPQG